MSGMLEMSPGKYAHPSGALWLMESDAVVVADAHLGYGWAQRPGSSPGPVLDGGAHRRLVALLEELAPKTLVFLGDVTHIPAPSSRDWAIIRDQLAALSTRAELVVVRSGHDRAAVRDPVLVRVRFAGEWRHGDVVAVHGDRELGLLPRGHILVAGHIYPVATVQDSAGVGHAMPAFLRSRNAFVLPAFSPFPGGPEVSRGVPDGLRYLLGHGPVQVAVSTGNRVAALKLFGGG